MHQLELQPAYILHTRAYRETSMLLEVFTKEQGRLSLIAKGVKRPKHPWRHVLMPFSQIAVSYAGKSDLLTLTQAEYMAASIPLAGNALFCGFYLNELLFYFLPKQDAYPDVFSLYQKTLTDLLSAPIEKTLRCFERQLLSLLGYEISLLTDSENQPIVAECFYHFQYEVGFLQIKQSPGQAATACYPGWVLQKIAAADYDDSSVLFYAKRLFCGKIQYLLGNKTIKSREMYF